VRAPAARPARAAGPRAAAGTGAAAAGAAACTLSPAPAVPIGRVAHSGRGEGPTDRRSAWVLRDGKPQMVSLRVGLSDGNLTEVIEGDLREGEPVVIDASVPDAPAGSGAPTGPGGMHRLF
ncbi:MAG TPA: hypothetical protein VFG23_04195, partial [Polyangia bacterium]|nr:hypothetical protein [Polyangia bacterium]